MDFLLKVIPKPKGEVKNLRFQGESKSKSPTGTILWEESNCRGEYLHDEDVGLRVGDQQKVQLAATGI
ncbi:hypothetical protein Pst134EA_011517 [Puccinia striiformis f. sp. tritici]|uniref:hypothetical protein n=1 Tax=Puccinia striiformis f. sp. tritici TaxID=168172 RepID=UPI002007E55D|nr:hypothetical protein Pst134EA_011517 [Puccinia striiformis f. sp. tritici]KAH9467898.1 hypothetical protein Pst134EA_011517 [Puccinia striiformis f. sp. tritici]